MWIVKRKCYIQDWTLDSNCIVYNVYTLCTQDLIIFYMQSKLSDVDLDSSMKFL